MYILTSGWTLCGCSFGGGGLWRFGGGGLWMFGGGEVWMFGGGGVWSSDFVASGWVGSLEMIIGVIEDYSSIITRQSEHPPV